MTEVWQVVFTVTTTLKRAILDLPIDWFSNSTVNWLQHACPYRKASRWESCVKQQRLTQDSDVVRKDSRKVDLDRIEFKSFSGFVGLLAESINWSMICLHLAIYMIYCMYLYWRNTEWIWEWIVDHCQKGFNRCLVKLLPTCSNVLSLNTVTCSHVVNR